MKLLFLCYNIFISLPMLQQAANFKLRRGTLLYIHCVPKNM